MFCKFVFVINQFEYLSITDDLRRGVDRKRIVQDLPIRSIMDKNSQVDCKTLANIARDSHIPVNGRYFVDDRTSARAALRAMEVGVPVANYVLDSSSTNLTVGQTFIVLGSGFQMEMLKKHGRRVLSIDSTHGTSKTRNTAPLLTTIIVQESGKEGYPVAYCVSDYKDEGTWRKFFGVLKDKIGRLHVETFLSDDDPSFFNAWSAVMGRPDSRRLCLWHVKRAWARKVNDN